MEIAAVASGRSTYEVESITYELMNAMNSKVSLLHVYESHVSSHGCG